MVMNSETPAIRAAMAAERQALITAKIVWMMTKGPGLCRLRGSVYQTRFGKTMLPKSNDLPYDKGVSSEPGSALPCRK